MSATVAQRWSAAFDRAAATIFAEREPDPYERDEAVRRVSKILQGTVSASTAIEKQARADFHREVTGA